jgi:hypothetical protein
VFGDPNPRLRIADIVEQRKILLIKAGPPDEIQTIYATLILSKIRQAIYRRAALPKNKITRFYLYCDEFQEYQTSDFDKLLSLAGDWGFVSRLPTNMSTKLRHRSAIRCSATCLRMSSCAFNRPMLLFSKGKYL